MARVIFAIVILLGTFAFTPQATQAASNVAGSWTASDALKTARKNHTSTLLFNGMVLIAGGDSNPAAMNSVELYVPGKNGSTLIQAMTSARYNHTATLLPDGTVLVTGGRGATYQALNTAELYDLINKTWTAIPNTMTAARSEHTATLLPDGNVLIVGGANTAPVQTAEIYNPVAKTFTATTGTLNTARSWHTATRLPNGKVLIAGGYNAAVLTSAEIYDLETQTFGLADTPLGSPRQKHTATLLPDGRVLIAGGEGLVTTYSTVEMYEYTFGTRGRFTPVAGSMQTNRREHTAALMPDGRVLLAGGFGTSGILNQVDLFDPLTDTFAAGPAMLTPRMNFAVTLLPDGRLLASGGWGDSGLIASAETFAAPQAYYRWKYTTGSLANGLDNPTVTLLVNGKVLLAGGRALLPTSTRTKLTAIYNPITQTFTMGQMNYAREQHTATALPNGRVLIFGGIGPNEVLLPNVELYDPISNSFIDLGGFPSRVNSAAVLLANGKVLVTGGYDANGSGTYRGAVLYTPSYSGGNGGWVTAVSLAIEARKEHTATLLRNGKVLLAGGASTTAAELYDPNATTNAFSYTGNMIHARKNAHRATLLPNGEVLLTGGSDGLFVQASAEIYNPQTGTFRATTPMHYPRLNHTALLLPNGKVLVAGGDNAEGILSQSEIYDPATETWTLIGSLNQVRYNGTAVVLPNGTPIFLAGTAASYQPVPSAEMLIAPLNYALPLVKR
jgi:WD40 repeat protein